MERSLDEALGEHGDLVEVLAKLVAVNGPEPLMRWPVVSVSPEHFPADSGQSVDSVAAIIVRLAQMAGLSNVAIRVVDERPDDDKAGVHETPDASFVGFDGGVAVFRLQSLGAPDLRIASLCHEVALCYGERPAGGHPYRTRATEPEPFTTDDLIRASVTTVFLGWGVIAANGAYRLTVTGSIQGYTARSEWSYGRVGVLSAGALCALLAVQSVARGLEARALPFAEELLENQRTAVARWVETLAPHRDELRRRLGVTAADRTDDAPPPVDRNAEPPLVIVRHPAHRVRRARTGELGVAGAFVGLVVLVAAVLVAPEVVEIALAAPVLGALAGAFLGRSRPRYFCSAIGCGAAMDSKATICQGCGRAIASEITLRELDELRAQRETGLEDLAEEQFDEGRGDDDLADDDLGDEDVRGSDAGR